MLQPKRSKFRKQFKGRNPGFAQRGAHVAFGEFGLKATSRARMTAREIEAARRAMLRRASPNSAGLGVCPVARCMRSENCSLRSFSSSSRSSAGVWVRSFSRYWRN